MFLLQLQIIKNSRKKKMILLTVPITGLDKNTHIALLGIILPLVGGIIISLLFTRFVAPLFLEAKRKALARKYTDMYIVREPKPFSTGTLIRRLIFLLAMTVGFLSLLTNALDPTQWLDSSTLQSYTERSLDPKHNFSFIIPLLGIGFPIAVGLWSVAWALEDAGLMHYVFKKDGYYEIEPVFVRYSLYLKGYSSISSILFLAEVFMYQAQQNSIEDGFLVVAAVLILLISFFPMYIILAKSMGSFKFLRKGLEEIKILTEDDVKK